MAQNTIQFQKGLSLPDFLKEHGTEEQCEQVKWTPKTGQQFKLAA